MEETSVFIFPDTDHTVGSLLQDELLTDSNVLFCAYDVPHPLKKEMHLHLLTIEQDESKKCINNSIDTILKNINVFEKEFNKNIKIKIKS